jgi:predicted nucleic acid-binding protein
MTKIFIDSAYAIALSAPNDRYHLKASSLAKELELKKARFITTRAVALEIGNALAKIRYRQASIKLLDALEKDPTIKIIPISDQLYSRAFHLYRDRPDKEWSLTDCISCIVMQDQFITEALTTDEHFQQMGFRALLLD